MCIRDSYNISNEEMYRKFIGAIDESKRDILSEIKKNIITYRHVITMADNMNKRAKSYQKNNQISDDNSKISLSNEFDTFQIFSNIIKNRAGVRIASVHLPTQIDYLQIALDEMIEFFDMKNLFCIKVYTQTNLYFE